MIRQIGLIGLVLIGLNCHTTLNAVQKKQQGIYLNAADAGADYQIQGEYTGTITGKGKFGVQIVALSKGKFDVYFLSGGLPGDGWDQETRTKVSAEREGDIARLTGKDYTGEISAGKLTGKTNDGAAFAFQKIERKSPKEGLPPPKGAIVLFDGKSADKWNNGKLTEGKYLDTRSVRGGFRSKENYGIGTYHIEFRTPFRPSGRGQGRGNSGVYIMGREIQVLDSFGLNGERNECGAYYGSAKPRVNMCYPPLTWQTFDVTLKADVKGQVRATVLHNGVMIHENFPIGRRADQPASINLQNHGNPVYFRNIWFLPSKKKSS